MGVDYWGEMGYNRGVGQQIMIRKMGERMLGTDYKELIEKRRTFAIISHPDAGKTTLTEKLLLYTGTIQLAGSVKGKKTDKHAVSDWMEIEKQRGISVTSSVMQFNYNGYCVNIIDTPGHQDFSEDTYRTLKLFKVCLLRDIPIFTFINKMDREAKSPYDLLEDIEEVLGIHTCPMNWPIGCGKDFKGVYEFASKEILAFTANNGQREVETDTLTIDDPHLDDRLGDDLAQTLRDDIELLEGAGDELDLDAVRHGKLTPVFFGSALTNFGVEPFLADFLKMTTPPLPRKTVDGTVDPFENQFSAFVFKIQANMNKAHRDRIAFMRICSGKYDKQMEVYHVQGDKKMRLSQPQQLMAQDREVIEEAYAGDIIGVFDPGIFSIGDTVCSPSKKVRFEGIPTFAPEHFAQVRLKDTMKRKQFVKGITQIAQEGAIQIFQNLGGGMEEVIVGVVGVLQFEVLEYRLKNEYNVDIILEGMPYELIRWIDNEGIDPKKLNLTSDTKRIQDLKGKHLLLFSSEWNITWALEHNKELVLTDFSKN